MPSCRVCGAKMMRGTLDLGTIKGSGFRRIYGIFWVCPNAKAEAGSYPNIFYYCDKAQKQKPSRDKSRRINGRRIITLFNKKSE